MYGMVNEGIRTYIVEHAGAETWGEIAAKAGLDGEDFETMLAYDDDITYRLVGATSEVMGLEPKVVLEAFGEFWIDFSSSTAIGRLLNFHGESFVEQLDGLNEMHAKIKLSMPHLNPPAFDVEEQLDGAFRVHYRSDRDGLQPMVIGLLKGLALANGEEIEIDLTQSRLDGADHDIFVVRLKEITEETRGISAAE